MNDLTEQPDELEPLKQAVELAGADVLDLGCGAGGLARRIMTGEGVKSIVAIDADAARIARNIRQDSRGMGVRYLAAGAEALPLADASIDVAVMMKSLHHVPVARMGDAFGELFRVLRPRGCLYICEPAYEGPFNDILRIFHDEGAERAAALRAIERALAGGLFRLTARADYLRPMRFAGFDDFRARMMHLPWLKNRITPTMEQQVKAAWQRYANVDGSALLPSRMFVFVLEVSRNVP